MLFVDMQGIKVPSLGLGTYQLTGNDGLRAFLQATDIGYRHFDTAQFYGNEEEVGSAVKLSGIDRKEFFITTKVWITNLAANDVLSSTELSLKKLKTDYVDLLLIHWPSLNNPKYGSKEVPLHETLEAMQKLKDQGKTRLIGVANFPTSLMRQAVEELGFSIACNQMEYHPLLSQKIVIDYARAHNIAITAYCPLAMGKIKDNKTLIDIGNKYGKSPFQVALRWLIEQKNVAAIPKAGIEKHARENFNIFDFKLSEEDAKAIFALNGNTRVVNASSAPVWD